jgi:hypothetical protein
MDLVDAKFGAERLAAGPGLALAQRPDSITAPDIRNFSPSLRRQNSIHQLPLTNQQLRFHRGEVLKAPMRVGVLRGGTVTRLQALVSYRKQTTEHMQGRNVPVHTKFLRLFASELARGCRIRS